MSSNDQELGTSSGYPLPTPPSTPNLSALAIQTGINALDESARHSLGEWQKKLTIKAFAGASVVGHQLFEEASQAEGFAKAFASKIQTLAPDHADYLTNLVQLMGQTLSGQGQQLESTTSSQGEIAGVTALRVAAVRLSDSANESVDLETQPRLYHHTSRHDSMYDFLHRATQGLAGDLNSLQPEAISLIMDDITTAFKNQSVPQYDAKRLAETYELMTSWMGLFAEPIESLRLATERGIPLEKVIKAEDELRGFMREHIGASQFKALVQRAKDRISHGNLERIFIKYSPN